MRIPGNVYSNAQIATRTDRSVQARENDNEKAAEGTRANKEKNVSVTLSSQAKQLASENALDTAKIDRLRAALANGTFNIDHAAIATKIAESGG